MKPPLPLESPEIEFKSEITEEQYSQLLQKYQLINQVIRQDNYYFDTPENAFLRAKKTLRLRIIHDVPPVREMTLKSSVQGVVNQESTHPFRADQLLEFLQQGIDLNEYYPNEGGKSPVAVCVATLTTWRASFSFREMLVCLDHSFSHGVSAFEVEMEVTEEKLGQEIFTQFLAENKLTYHPSGHKSSWARQK
jgi:uncharacterized protein YjbK